jgi:hypothetical protein
MAMPVTAQSRKRGISFFKIFPLTGLNKNNNQNRPVATKTLIRFKPKGKMSDGEISLTMLKLTPNKKLAVSRAIWAFAFGKEDMNGAKVDDPKNQIQ